MADLSGLVASALPGAQVVREAGAPGAPSDVLAVRPNHPFFFHITPMHPGSWDAQRIYAGPGVPEEDVGLWWLPKLRMIPVKPGLLGMRTKKTGAQPGEAYNMALQRLRDEGRVVLDHSLGYLVSVPCRCPRTRLEGTYYMDAWSTPRVKIQGKAQKFDTDRQRLYRWLLALIREGHIPAPHPSVVDARQAQIAERVERRKAVASTLLAGDEGRADGYLAEVADRAQAAEEARLPETLPRGGVIERDASDPDQMTYAELRELAKALGWRTGGRKTEELRAIVAVDLSPEDAEAEGYDIEAGYPLLAEEG